MTAEREFDPTPEQQAFIDAIGLMTLTETGSVTEAAEFLMAAAAGLLFSSYARLDALHALESITEGARVAVRETMN